MTNFDRYEIVHGDAVETLARIETGTVDAVITDPPYPEIERDYGTLSTEEWFTLMAGVVREVRRVLKPSGSAMFVLQPNSFCNGSMRPWLWEWLALLATRWNVIQDVYWWNYGAMPLAGTRRSVGLLRGSLKYCVWCGPADAYRNQAAVLWEPSEYVKASHREKRAFKNYESPDGKRVEKNKAIDSIIARGGVTPYNVIPLDPDGPQGNVIPLANTDSRTSGGALGHPAATPKKLAQWWIDYICPPEGLVVDPFCGSATVPLAAVESGRLSIGIEAKEEYYLMGLERMRTIVGP